MKTKILSVWLVGKEKESDKAEVVDGDEDTVVSDGETEEVVNG